MLAACWRGAASAVRSEELRCVLCPGGVVGVGDVCARGARAAGAREPTAHRESHNTVRYGSLYL